MSACCISVGCSDAPLPAFGVEPEPAPDAGQGGHGDGGAGGSAGGGGLMLRVVGAASNSGDFAPVEGATVAVDLADGTRVEGATDADGVVVFAGVDPAAGPIDAVGHKPGYGIRALLGVDPLAEELIVRLLTQAVDGVRVAGRAGGFLDPGHQMTIYTVPAFGFHNAIGNSWSLEVAPGAPFTLVGMEWDHGTEPTSPRGGSTDIFGWAVLSHEGVTEPAALELEFSAGASVQYEGSFPLPEGDGILAQTGVPSVAVGSGLGSIFGYSTYVDVAPDGATAVYRGEYLPLPDVEPVTLYILGGPGDRVGMAEVPGYPQGGVVDVVLPESPEPTSTIWQAVSQPLSWTIQEQDSDLLPVIQLVSADGVVSRVSGPAGSTELRLPPLPSSASWEQILGDGAIGHLYLCDRTPAGRCQRIAFSDSFSVVAD